MSDLLHIRKVCHIGYSLTQEIRHIDSFFLDIQAVAPFSYKKDVIQNAEHVLATVKRYCAAIRL